MSSEAFRSTHKDTLATEFGSELALKSVAQGGGSVGKIFAVPRLKGKNGAGNVASLRILD